MVSVTYSFKREKSPFRARDGQRIRHGLRKADGLAVLALGVPLAQLTLTTGLGLGPGGAKWLSSQWLQEDWNN